MRFLSSLLRMRLSFGHPLAVGLNRRKLNSRRTSAVVFGKCSRRFLLTDRKTLPPKVDSVPHAFGTKSPLKYQHHRVRVPR